MLNRGWNGGKLGIYAEQRLEWREAGYTLNRGWNGGKLGIR